MIKKIKNTLGITKLNRESLLAITLFILDPRISLKDIVNVDSDNFTQPDEVDINLTKNILQSYNKMIEKIGGGTIGNIYKPGAMWDNIININKKDFYGPMKKNDVNRASVLFANFFRTMAIEGLWEGGTYQGNNRMSRMSMGGKLSFIIATLRNYDFWHILTNESLDIIDLPKVGNPFGYKINGHIVSIAQFKMHYHSQQVYNLIRDLENPVVVEVGGGFGGIPYYLFKMGFNGTYLNFDLPETLVLSEYFLQKSLPDKGVLIYDGHEQLTLEHINYYDVILMPNFMLKNMPDLCADIVVNTRSFSEIPMETLEEYLLQIDRICKKYLYHDNANFKSHQYEIPAYEFPIPAAFKLLTKVKSLWYGGNTAKNRFVEYLYEKK